MRTLIANLAIACLAGSAIAAEPSGGTANTPFSVARWGVLELTVAYSGALENPFQDVEAVAEAVGPGGRSLRVCGFYDGDGAWRFRIVPDIEGAWQAKLSLLRDGKVVAGSETSFTCKGREGHGFVRISARNPYRFEWDDGTPFYPIGIQPGGYKEAGLDGPPGGHGAWRSVDWPTYLDAFQGKANLLRYQLGAGDTRAVAGEVLTGKEGLYRYNLEFCRGLDESMRLARSHGFAAILTAFQDMSVWGEAGTAFGDNRATGAWKDASSAETFRPVKAYLKYLVARYGAYVDIWEFFNEDSFTQSDRLAEMAAFVRKEDPYRHLLTTNVERPQEPWCDMATPHEYMWMPASEIDGHLCKELLRLKSFGKPVLYTEFGNQRRMSNVDPVKWRVAVWVAFMNESALLFWHMGGIQVEFAEKSNANAYLGPQARQYFAVFQGIVKDVPVTARPVNAGWTEKGEKLWRYALSDGRMTLLYVHHYGDHTTPHEPRSQKVWTGPGRFRITWLDPATGEVLKTGEAASDLGYMLTVDSPEITVDAVAKIEKSN